MNLITQFPVLYSLKNKMQALFSSVTKEKGKSPRSTQIRTSSGNMDANRGVSLPTGCKALQAVRRNHSLTLILNRPEVLNAIDIEMAEALKEQLTQAAADPSVRVVVITGKGRAFCSGGDLKFALEANLQQPGDSFMALTSVFACVY